MRLTPYEISNIDLIRKNLISYWQTLNSIVEDSNLQTHASASAQIDEITRNLQKTCEFTEELSKEIKARREEHESLEAD